MRIGLGQQLYLCILLSLFCSCDAGDAQPRPALDAGTTDALGDASKGNTCGVRDSVLEIGADEPFVEVPKRDGRYVFKIFEGHQGGYHIDVSVRVTGGLDPDEVNVDMRLGLKDEPVAIHTIDQWYLKLVEDRSHCEYPKGQLVFAHESGELFTLDEVEALLDQTLSLTVKMDGSNESVRSSYKIVLTDVVRLSENSDAGVEETP